MDFPPWATFFRNENFFNELKIILHRKANMSEFIFLKNK